VRLRTLGRIALAVVGLSALALGAGFVALRSSLPTVDGEARVSGIGAEVDILRDGNDVPHILAASWPDAYFGLGYAHAQDRLWQMEVRRRLGAGRLSEILGARTVALDRFFRTLGLDRVAARNLAGLDDATRAALAAYARGVNAFLADRRGLLPPEFVILGAPAPEPWRPRDSLLMLKLMSWELSGNWRDEMLRQRLARRLSPAQLAALWPPYPAAAPVVMPTLAPPALAPLLDLFPQRPPGLGSNGWVVGGSLSASGKPLLANDTHLGLSTPGPFYLAQIAAGGANAVGATLPGFPFVILGRNDRIAWGLTNAYPDTQDLYVERLDPADAERYLTPDGWRRFRSRRETIRVAGGPDVEITLRESRHGPVISARDEGVAPAEVLALAWTALDDDDRSAEAVRRLTMARDWDAFLAAGAAFGGPQQTILYADVDGHIGAQAPARIPARAGGRGRSPAPGWSGDYDWVGFLPPSVLPRQLDPPAARIVSANNRVVPKDYPYFLTDDWAAPYRTERIQALLQTSGQASVATFSAMQADVTSLMARRFLPFLRQTRAKTGTERRALALIKDWDGEMAAARPEPLIFSAWYRTLTRLVEGDELGGDLPRAWRPRPVFMARALAGDDAGWCDDVTSETVETCAERSQAAFERAIATLVEAYGDAPADWRWDDAHRATLAHGVFRGQPILGWLFGTRQASGGGDAFTINAGGYGLGDNRADFTQTHGAVFRAVYDLADLDRSLFLIRPGQSGNLLSPHYADLVPRFAANRPFAIATRRDDIAVEDRLVLRPR